MPLSFFKLQKLVNFKRLFTVVCIVGFGLHMQMAYQPFPFLFQVERTLLGRRISQQSNILLPISFQISEWGLGASKKPKNCAKIVQNHKTATKSRTKPKTEINYLVEKAWARQTDFTAIEYLASHIFLDIGVGRRAV